MSTTKNKEDDGAESGWGGRPCFRGRSRRSLQRKPCESATGRPGSKAIQAEGTADANVLRRERMRSRQYQLGIWIQPCLKLTLFSDKN